MTTLLVTGDRKWGKGKTAYDDILMLNDILTDMVKLYGIDKIIEGCANGLDRLVGWPCPVKLAKGEPEPPRGWAKMRGIPVDHNPADWDRYLRAAGPIRNTAMLKKKPDLVAAFHRSLNTSKGTGHMVKIAREAGLDVFTFP